MKKKGFKIIIPLSTQTKPPSREFPKVTRCHVTELSPPEIEQPEIDVRKSETGNYKIKTPSFKLSNPRPPQNLESATWRHVAA